MLSARSALQPARVVLQLAVKLSSPSKGDLAKGAAKTALKKKKKKKKKRKVSGCGYASPAKKTPKRKLPTTSKGMVSASANQRMKHAFADAGDLVAARLRAAGALRVLHEVATKEPTADNMIQVKLFHHSKTKQPMVRT